MVTLLIIVYNDAGICDGVQWSTTEETKGLWYTRNAQFIGELEYYSILPLYLS